MKKIFNNKEIVLIINSIYENFQNDKELILPLKVNYALQVNYKLLSEKGEFFNKMKENISKKYGEFSIEQNDWIIKDENVIKAQNEFDQYLEVEQSIDIMTIILNDLNDCKLTTQQMQTLLFMIEE